MKSTFLSLFTAVLTLTGLVSQSSSHAQAPPIRILPLGDSITFGSSVAGGYRNKLYQLLTTAGYNVDYVGVQNGNGVATLPDSDHQGIGGWRIDQVDADIPKWLGVVADPDVILLHIGTNDFGQNLDTVNAINRWDALITKLATRLPYAHIIATNLMERNETTNTTIQTQFNPYVVDRINAQAALGRRVTFLNMRAAVPVAEMPDALHPGQVGYDHMADAWFPAIQAIISPLGDNSPPAVSRVQGAPDRTHVSVTFSKPVADGAATVSNFSLSGGLTVSAASLDASKRIVTLTTSQHTLGANYTVTMNGVVDRTAGSLALPANTTSTFFAATPRGYLNNIPESVGYTLAYSLDIPAAANYKVQPPVYSVDNRNAIGPINRVAYYLELQQANGDLQYLWASMNSFTPDAGKIAVPTIASGALFQTGVTGMNVVSNVPGITTGTNLAGNVEFWPTNYQSGNAANVPGASPTNFDFGDQQTAGNYGSMQLHNAAAGQTLFAFNNWGGNPTPGDLDLGIGNNPSPTNLGVDWTFAHNAAGFTVRSLQVLVKTDGDRTSPTLVSAAESFGQTQITVTFSEAILPSSVQAGNFTLSNGVTVIGATALSSGREVLLTTTTQPLATPLTLTVSGVRDTSSYANVISPGSTITVSSPALPPEIASNVGALANGYQTVLSANLPVTGNFNALGAAAYSLDDRQAPGAFSRVAYYLELQVTGSPSQYVWASMDAFTINRGKLGIPTLASGAVFQQNVTNLEVKSNVAGVVQGTTAAGGNIEFWPQSYTQANGAAVPNANAGTYDFGDTRTGTLAGYGCMQIHNHDVGAAQTVMALNNFGGDGNILDVGIGNNATNPDSTFAANAGSYTRRILHVLVLPMANPTLPPAVATNVGAPATGYQLVYSLAIPATGNSTNLVYSVNNSADVGSFSRIGYYMELQTGTNTPNYMWTSMDAFTTDARKIAVPTVASGGFFQQNVSNLFVKSNVAGIVQGSTVSGGNIEFWPGNYNQSNSAGVPNADAAVFDFGDGGASATAGHGSMQVHNHDVGAKQTLFAFNHFGATTGTFTYGLGIGNRASTADPDWTFADNANTYSNRTLHVFVLPGNTDVAGPTISKVTPSTSLNRLVVTFNEKVTDSSAVIGNFSLGGGLTITSATLLANQTEIALTTSAQTPGTTYTVSVSNIRDRSPVANASLPGASGTFTGYQPPAILANVPETSGFQLLYRLPIPDAAQYNVNAVPYTIDESKYPQLQPFDRVAYLMELTTGATTSWVYVSCDPFTTDVVKLGVPTVASGAVFQTNISNMTVAASAGAPVVTGTGLTGGNIEFWPTDYSAANGNGVLNASGSNYDWGDTRTLTGTYGSMQIHNQLASQTLFAYNNWGGSTGNSCLGIGNDPAPVTAGVDWTFHNNAPSYSAKNLYVLGRPGGTPVGAVPTILSQPIGRLVNGGTNTSLLVVANGTGPFSYQWRLNGSPINGATNSWLDLNNITFAQQGTYDVVVTGPGATNTVSAGAQVDVNRQPTFSGYAFTTSKNTAATILLAKLLAKITDADGDAFSITGVSPVSAGGGTVSLNAGGVLYTPLNNFVNNDTFTLTIMDARGAITVATVNVAVTAGNETNSNQSSLTVMPNGSVQALFYGIPGRSYQIQRSENLTSWMVLETVTAGANGIINFNDPSPPSGGTAFYRTKEAP